MASQQQQSPYLTIQAHTAPARMAAQLYTSKPTPEAMQALRFENQGLRGHSDFLAQQLWRQGQAYQQLAAYCHEICGEKTASATALAGVQAMLDATRFALESERQRHVSTKNSHNHETRRRVASEEILAREYKRVRGLVLLVSQLSFMELEDIERISNDDPDFSKLLEQALIALADSMKQRRIPIRQLYTGMLQAASQEAEGATSVHGRLSDGERYRDTEAERGET